MLQIVGQKKTPSRDFAVLKLVNKIIFVI